MRLTPHTYQQAAIDDAVRFFEAAGPNSRRLYAAPTGTGKSVVELAIQERFPDAWVITPRVEIIAGMMDKLGVAYSQDAADAQRIITPIRFRNALLEGRIDSPKYLIFDEAHHESAQSWQDLILLSDYPTAIGFTATPFRGSPRATVKLRKEWGEPVWIITMREAAHLGALSVPACRIEPLLDDDKIDVRNGEFTVESANRYAKSRLGDVNRLVRDCPMMFNGIEWDKPTLFSVNSREIAYALNRTLNYPYHVANAPTTVITGESTASERQSAFARCIDRRTAIIQIQVVSEGVDFPFARLIDLAPTLSPVKWLQQFGRITRPGGGREYICCCKNLLRFAYLLEGLLPPEQYSASATMFPESNRNTLGRRVFGLEAVGRFKGEPLPLSDGTEGLLYCVSAVEGNQVQEYCAIVTPLSPHVLWARRENERADKTTYGKWRRCEAPDDVTGFSSVTPKALSEKQAAWWEKSAKRFGLDPTAEVNRRNFVALPVLTDLRIKL